MYQCIVFWLFLSSIQCFMRLCPTVLLEALDRRQNLMSPWTVLGCCESSCVMFGVGGRGCLRSRKLGHWKKKPCEIDPGRDGYWASTLVYNSGSCFGIDRVVYVAFQGGAPWFDLFLCDGWYSCVVWLNVPWGSKTRFWWVVSFISLGVAIL